MYFKAGQGLSLSTGGTLLQLAVTAPMMPPATRPVPTAVNVREMQSSGLSTGSLSDCTEAGVLAPPTPLMVSAWALYSRTCLAPSRSELCLFTCSTYHRSEK